MKLAFINFYSGYANRGGETYVNSLASLLSKNHEVFLYQAGPKKSGESYQVIRKPVLFEKDHPHLALPVTHMFKRLFIDYAHVRELLFTLKVIPDLLRLKPDYIFPQNSGWEIFLLTFICKLMGIKIIIAGQSGPGWNDRVNLFFHPDVFVALTHAQATWAKKVTIWKNQKIVVIPNGVDLNRFLPVGSRLTLKLKKPIVLTVGAAIKSKRVKETINAMKQIKQGSLLVVGTGPDEGCEDQLGTDSLGKDRYQRLKTEHSQMAQIYRSVDVFTLCSDNSEAFGIVYLEAMATGLPVVATDDPSRREIIGDAGFFVANPLDAKEYADTILQALKNRKSDKIQKQVRKFSWDKIARQYQDLIANDK